MHKLNLLILFVSVLCCQNNSENNSVENNPLPIEQPTNKTSPDLTVSVDKLRLRDQAGENGKVLTELEKGSKLYDLEEMSDFTTKLSLRGIQYDEPWLKVATENKETGWVYGGAVHYDNFDKNDFSKKVLQNRLQVLVGKTTTKQILAYKHLFETMKTANDFAYAYQQGLLIRNLISNQMDEKMSAVNEEEADLSWLEKSMPGFIIQTVAEGTMYHLFVDYKPFLLKAKKTKSELDNQFIDLCLEAYSLDSIEYFFPAWTIQTWDYGGHSLLGQGKHTTVLDKITGVVDSLLFKKEALLFKDRVVQDIIGEETSYWENQAKIVTELENIIKTDYTCLSTADKIAISRKLEAIKDPVANNIQINLRLGE